MLAAKNEAMAATQQALIDLETKLKEQEDAFASMLSMDRKLMIRGKGRDEEEGS